MKRFFIGTMVAGSLIAAWTCKGDPTSSLRGGPASFSVTPGQIYLNRTTDSVAALVVVVRDAQLNPVQAVVTATSGAPSIASVTADTTRTFIDSSTYAFVVKAHAVGTAKLTLTGGGVTDSSVVHVQ